MASDNAQQPKTRSEDPESAPLIRVWTEDMLDKQPGQWMKTDDNCLSKSQATHSEVVVEVLIHKDPGSVEQNKQ